MGKFKFRLKLLKRINEEANINKEKSKIIEKIMALLKAVTMIRSGVGAVTPPFLGTPFKLGIIKKYLIQT